ncbi:MAG: signal peptidase II [Bacillota bacterium]
MAFWIPFLGILAFDQLSKWYVRSNFALGQSLPVIGKWLQVVYRENAGAAFGILSGARWFFVAASIISIGFAVFLYPRLEYLGWHVVAGLGFVAGGALGNVIDRVCQGTVTDFISVRYFPAVFNVADSGIVVGSFVLAIALIIYSQRMN